MRYCLVLIIMMLVPVDALAHKLGVYAWPEEGGVVVAEGYFVDGSPCLKCGIQAYDAQSGALMANSPTDEEGQITFTSTAEELRLVLTAPGGHRTEELVTLEPSSSGQPSGQSAAKARAEKAGGPSLMNVLAGLAAIAVIAKLWSYMAGRKRG